MKAFLEPDMLLTFFFTNYEYLPSKNVASVAKVKTVQFFNVMQMKSVHYYVADFQAFEFISAVGRNRPSWVSNLGN